MDGAEWIKDVTEAMGVRHPRPRSVAHLRRDLETLPPDARIVVPLRREGADAETCRGVAHRPRER